MWKTFKEAMTTRGIKVFYSQKAKVVIFTLQIKPCINTCNGCGVLTEVVLHFLNFLPRTIRNKNLRLSKLTNTLRYEYKNKNFFKYATGGMGC